MKYKRKEEKEREVVNKQRKIFKIHEIKQRKNEIMKL